MQPHSPMQKRHCCRLQRMKCGKAHRQDGLVDRKAAVQVRQQVTHPAPSAAAVGSRAATSTRARPLPSSVIPRGRNSGALAPLHVLSEGRRLLLPLGDRISDAAVCSGPAAQGSSQERGEESATRNQAQSHSPMSFHNFGAPLHQTERIISPVNFTPFETFTHS